ncbi:MAG: histidine kinase [Rubrivivax sp.]|nr:histidine kinase [Rubrivivax sp.]
MRVLLAAQLAGAAGAALAAPGGAWGPVQAGTAFALLLATLAWLGGLCAARGALQRLAARGQLGLAAVWGLLCVLLAQTALVWAGLWAPPATAWAGAAAAGALAAGLCWAWLVQRQRLVQPTQNQARLAELQSRIRPHLLFNALNAALALVRVDPERAERVLEDLSELFRQALAESGSSISLAEEIELARRYLDIEQVRFGDRLRLSWAIDPRVGGARVPPLVLQPLVENAVRHGVEPALEGGEVQIQARLWQGLVQLEVRNSLPPQASRPGSGMALANVAERLKLLHDMAAHCDAGPQPGPHGPQFVARISVPV